MQTSVAGNRRLRPGGFTLLELLVVVSIIAIATAGVALSLRDSAQARVERDAQRLAALLESGRAQSRMRGVAVQWQSTQSGFRFAGLPEGVLPGTWLDGATVVEAGATLNLGPEPILVPQSVVLSSAARSGTAWRVVTDGLHPFAVEPQ